jgi:transposase-like protein
MTKAAPETVLNQEMIEHPGHDKHGPAGNEAGNAERDQIEDSADREHWRGRHHDAARPGLDVRPTDRPQAVVETDRVDEMVVSLYAKGLTTGEIQAFTAETYCASVSKRRRSDDH